MNDAGGAFEEGSRREIHAVGIPQQPGALLPNPGFVWDAASAALQDLERLRGCEPTVSGYAAECHKAVGQAAFAAAADTASQLVREAHVDGSWAENNPAPKNPRLHVVHSGPGSGKSTAAKAFMAGLTRSTEHHRYPIGCALLVHHVETAASAFAELSALLRGKVAVWSSEHDANSLIVVRQPRFTVEELEEHPVIVVTHEFYRGVRGERARTFRRNGVTLPRFVTFVDEKVSEVETYTLFPSQVQQLIEHVQRDEQAPAELRGSLDVLEAFVRSTKVGPRSLETPSHNPEPWRMAQHLAWFTSEEAARWSRTQMASLRNTRRAQASPDDVKAVFGFARCMVNEQAFIKRVNEGQLGTSYVGYERAFPQLPGMVLLDATADVDGVSKLCPWRKHTSTPRERYDNLEIVQVPTVASGTLSRWLRDPQHRAIYVRHIQETVLEHVRPGQSALIVCKLDAVDLHPPIPSWSEHVAQFKSKKPKGLEGDHEQRNAFPWDYQGRRLGLTWWGGYGIGANDWKDADAVLLFDEYHLPGHTNIAVTQGLQSRKATHSALSNMVDTRTKVDEVERIRIGHLLRWIRQMALRGKARRFDEEGRCATQKLVLAGDGLFLTEHGARLFPGAKISFAATGGGTHLERLIALLRDTPLPHTVKAVDVGKMLGVVWRDVGNGIVKHARFEPLLASLGWQYVRGSGKGGSYFVKHQGDTEPNLNAVNLLK